MDRLEFAKIIAFLEAGCGKQLAADSVEVYYALLGNLPVDVLQEAAKQALLTSRFPVFPQIGTLHEHAQTFMRQRNRAQEMAAILERKSLPISSKIVGQLTERLKMPLDIPSKKPRSLETP